MNSRPLLAQVLAVNLLLVAGTVLVATVAVDAHLTSVTRGREVLVLGLAIVATLLGNWLLLRRRFEPLDELISAMEGIDLAAPEEVSSCRPRAPTAPRCSGWMSRSGAWSAGSSPSAARRAGRRSRPRSVSAAGSPRTFTTRSTRR